MKKTIFNNLILIIGILIVTSVSVQSQTYRYLKFKVMECENYKAIEINWYSQGVDYPNPHLTSVKPEENPNNEQVIGDGSDWSLLNIYDGDNDTHHWIGEITDTLLYVDVILDLGEENGIIPDSVEIINPGYANLYRFQIWASDDNQNWTTFLDTSLVEEDWSAKTFELELMSDIKPPTAPNNLTANYVTSNRIKLIWGASTDNIAVVEYEIFQNGVSIGTSPSTNTSFQVTGLTSESSYNFHVVAKDFANNISVNSNEILVFTNALDTEVPSAPVGLISNSVQSERLDFSWSPSTDNIAVVGYIIYLDDVPVGTSEITQFSIPGLDPLTQYKITIKAKDGASNISNPSSELSVTTILGGVYKMKIGTNFWDMSWGSHSADPFVNTHELVTEDNPWRTDLLEEVGIYSGYRFMDWGLTNNSEIDHWLDRKMKTNINQREMAFEWMIDFSNRSNRDLWICIPHKVISRDGYERGNNHFVKKLAILLKTGVDMMEIDLDNTVFDNLSEMTKNELIALGGQATCAPLKPHLKVYIEYSNETWNWGFWQTSYCRHEGYAVGLNPGYTGLPDEDWTSWIRFHAWAALRVFEQMEDVFGDDSPRLMKIDAYQSVGYGQIESHLYVYDDTANIHNPRGIYPDAFSPAPYFGDDANGNDGAAVYITKLDSSLNARVADLGAAREILNKKEVELGKKFKLISYEGGQHVTKGADIINRDVAMYDIYTRYLDSCSMYLDEFWHYTHSGKFGEQGAWGAIEFVGEDIAISHKFRAIKDWIAAPPQAPIDIIPPTVPVNLKSGTSTQNSITFSWDASTDNVGVHGYKIFMSNFYMGYSNSTFYELSGLTPSTSYQITVAATDTVGNTSAESEMLEMSTLSTQTHSVTFTVTDESGVIEGASVDFQSKSILTDNTGEAVFNDLLPGMALKYSVAKNGFITYSDSLNIVDTSVLENVVMRPNTYSATFNITDGTSVISGAKVEFQSVSTLTDSDGQAVFYGILAGTGLTYEITKTGYDTIIGSVDVIDINITEPITINLSTYSVKFIVTDGSDIIEGASVDFQSKSVLTDNAGEAIFKDLLPANNLEYTITKVGYETQASTTDIVDSNVEESITLVLSTDIESDEESDVLIFPNPVTNTFAIVSKKQMKQMKLFSISGSEVLSKTTTTHKYKVNAENIKKGVYLLIITYTDETKETHQIIK